MKSFHEPIILAVVTSTINSDYERREAISGLE
jgi:hypothetical protein